MKITVIGCGAGAFATAADLSMKGHDVLLYVSKDHKKNFEVIKDTKTIICYGEGDPKPVKIAGVTTDVKKAFKNYDLIMVVTPTFAHESIAKDIAPYVKDGDNIVLSPGSTGGAFVFKKVFKDMGKCDDVRISEIHTLPYTARKVGMDGVNIFLDVEYLLFSVFPSKYNDEVFPIIKELYPSIVLCHSVLETSLNNGNATTHPAPMVLNAGKIEFYGEHNHYSEGITPSVGNVIQLIDDERKAICRKFGYDELDIKDRLYKMGYCPRESTVYDCIHGDTSVFLPIEGPNSLSNRYLTEDAPCSLVAMSTIASIVGVKTPLMDAVVNLAGALMSNNYWHSGRNAKAMGIENMTKEELIDYVTFGC